MKHGNGLNRLLCILLAIALALGLASCSSLSKQERRIRKGAGVDLDLSGCRIERETDTHGGFLGDGEYLLVIDCGGKEEKLRAQTSAWAALPLSKNLQEVLHEWGPTERNTPPRIEHGVWLFYDRFSDTDGFDRRSDERLTSRPAQNFSLLIYDSDSNRLYYYELDT